MSTRPRRLLLTVPVVLMLAACGGTSGSPQSTSGQTGEPAATPSAAPSSSTTAAGQTDTEWGRIWDTIPAGFPRFPGSTIADEAGGQSVSARFAVPGGDAQEIASWMQGALESATFSTVGLNGPFEDGSFVLDSVGDGDCRIQTTISPAGDTTFISVLYGASCPP
jgi:hypothetical protein